MHSPKPLSASEILNSMPTDKNLAEIYRKMTRSEKLSEIIPDWSDAIAWEELHRSGNYPSTWN